MIKSLSNEIHLNILNWLKNPLDYFLAEELAEYGLSLGISASSITKKGKNVYFNGFSLSQNDIDSRPFGGNRKRSIGIL